jgi:hypothetical protein
VLAAWPLSAAGPSPVDFVWGVALALSNGDTAAFHEAFDPAMPGFKAVQSGADALMAQARVESHIQFHQASGEGPERTLELDWSLDITQRGGIPGLTHRAAKVRCRLVDRGGKWRITSFEPADLFAPPPDMAGMWNMFHEAASALNNGDIGEFLRFFDPAFAAKIHLKDAVAEFQVVSTIERDVATNELQPSLDLVLNEGDDRARTVGIDWAMDLVQGMANTELSSTVSGVVNVRKNDRVTFRVARDGKKWRIESFEPADFFQMPPPKN